MEMENLMENVLTAARLDIDQPIVGRRKKTSTNAPKDTVQEKQTMKQVKQQSIMDEELNFYCVE
jgi:hypothetical protein